MVVAKGIAIVSLRSEKKTIRLKSQEAIGLLEDECQYLRSRLIWFLRKTTDLDKISQVLKAVQVAIDARLAMANELKG